VRYNTIMRTVRVTAVAAALIAQPALAAKRHISKKALKIAAAVAVAIVPAIIYGTSRGRGARVCEFTATTSSATGAGQTVCAKYVTIKVP
jgi:hypothetical protein